MTPEVFKRAIQQLSKLPGVGEKTASRLVFFILKTDPSYVKNLCSSLLSLREKLKLCEECFSLSETNLCVICKNPSRDKSLLCVIETPQDLVAIEKSRKFSGIYHILHGRLSPLDGITPNKIKIDELLVRLKRGAIREVILALNPNMEGETTALYLSKLIKPRGIKITHLAQGIPMGSDLEYIDEVTMGRAITHRIEL
ncbi:MAG: recombination protein RecR [Deltaproteobacteria bacterium]|nr:recombination protein RecR [Deltaproteobacteria bacterium]